MRSGSRAALALLMVVALATTGCAPAAQPETEGAMSGAAEQVVTEAPDMVTYEVTSEDSAPVDPQDRPTSTLRGLSGQVVDVDGSPVADAFILVECETEPCPALPDLGVLTNEEGRFHWPLPEGRFTVVAQRDSLRSEAVTVTVTGEQQDPVSLTMLRLAE